MIKTRRGFDREFKLKVVELSYSTENMKELASGHDPGAYGTFTLWNTQFHELYSPFKAHTLANKAEGLCGL